MKKQKTYSSPNKNLCNNKTRDCKSCLQKRYSLLEGLAMEELEQLSHGRYSVEYKKGEIIYKEGSKPQGLLCLNQGKVKITKLGVNGTEQIIGLKKPVDFVGFKALMREMPFRNTAVALEDTSLCIIEKKDFFEVVEQNKQLAFRIFKYLANELVDIEDRMLNLTQKHLRARLADSLILLSEVFGIEPDKMLKVEMKRSDIASLSNMTPSNATRVLSDFSKEHLISVNYRRIYLMDINALHFISANG